VVRLDREVVGRTPAVVNAAPTALPDDHPLVINGYPTGLPLKIDDGANVRDARADTLDFFVANLDTFGGNSGSGVFDDTTKQLVGILVRGEVDYVFDPEAECDRVNVCPNDGCSGEDSTYAFRALEALCASGEAAPGLCPCGDGTCDAEGGESTATCPSDCGTECGDGVCNGDETNESCLEDCPLEPTTCELPIEVVVQATQTLTGDTTGASNDLEGSCVGGGAPDHVYALTLTADATVDAVVGGYDTGMYLRSACDDPDSELDCNDDIALPENLGSQITQDLTAGQYFLVVDGFRTNAGEYTLTIDVTCADPTDTDGDGTADCVDGCAADPDKTEPGQCGCGVPDTDSDTDGTADCVDACAADPAKTEPGQCGCGVADTDTDSDGTADCADPCPEDAGDDCESGTDDDGTDDDGTDDDGTDDDGTDDSGSDDSSGDDSSGDDSSGDDDGRNDDDGCSAAGGGSGPQGALILMAFAALGLRRRRTASRHG
jgi:MYXO-CTERM domain-containing protein